MPEKPFTRRAFFATACGAALRAADEDLGVYTDAPRLLLRPPRLRLLRRERERRSVRWEQFDALIANGAPLPETGFAAALHYQVSGRESSAKQAVDFATRSSDVRQAAMVYDWCQQAMTAAQKRALESKLERALAVADIKTVTEARSVAFAAVALADNLKDHGSAPMDAVVGQWWRARVLPALARGGDPLPRADFLALLELFHVVRDNVTIDLRETDAVYFHDLAVYQLVSHYPAPFESADNAFHIPSARDGQPDLARAAYSRAAGLATVAFDTNALESQFLQGWLAQDRFIMRGTLGAPYEFLWANPYQPGLSYRHMPLVWHDTRGGRLFARSSWDDDATWVGFFDREMQWFEDGRVRAFKPSVKPQQVGPATFFAATMPTRFDVDEEEATTMFLLGLTPRARFDVEIDDQEMREEFSDAGGVLALHFPAGTKAGVRIKQS